MSDLDRAILDRAILDRARAIAQRDAARERLQRAYTLLVSVQPAAHRQTLASTNDTALHLHTMLEQGIQAWVDDYLKERDA